MSSDVEAARVQDRWTGSIGSDELAAVARAQRLGLLIGACGVVFAVSMVAGAVAGWPPLIPSVGIPVGFVVACLGVAYAAHHRDIARVGSVSGWRLAQVEVTTVGHGRNQRLQVRLADCYWPHQAWGVFSSGTSLRGRTQLEVAGDPAGTLLLRAPGDRRVVVAKPRR